MCNVFRYWHDNTDFVEHMGGIASFSELLVLNWLTRPVTWEYVLKSVA